jgi:heme/copper-type cytochrome/quinol oxidase subunit 2
MSNYLIRSRPRSTGRYTATPPTEPGWYRLRSDPACGAGYYRFSVVEVVEYKDTLVVWLDGGSSWVPVKKLDTLWGDRVNF